MLHVRARREKDAVGPCGSNDCGAMDAAIGSRAAGVYGDTAALTALLIEIDCSRRHRSKIKDAEKQDCTDNESKNPVLGLFFLLLCANDKRNRDHQAADYKDRD